MAGLFGQLPYASCKLITMLFQSIFTIGLTGQILSDGGQVRELVGYELRRLTQFDDPRELWVLLGIVSVLLVGFVAWFYRRERDVLSAPLRWTLTGPTGDCFGSVGTLSF